MSQWFVGATQVVFFAGLCAVGWGWTLPRSGQRDEAIAWIMLSTFVVKFVGDLVGRPERIYPKVMIVAFALLAAATGLRRLRQLNRQNAE